MKTTSLFTLLLLLVFGLMACGPRSPQFDASGAFEADEVIVSAEVSGRILRFLPREGDTLAAGQEVGAIDAANLELQRAQLEATTVAIGQRTTDAQPQVNVLEQQIRVQQSQLAAQREQLAVWQREQTRLEKLVAAEAAPPKQLDDLNGQMRVLQKQIAAAEAQLGVLQAQIVAQRELVALQNRAVLSEQAPNAQRVAQVADLISRARILNPTAGTVLLAYARAGEMTAPGKALYKIADLRQLTLRAYLTGNQLAQIKLGQTVTVHVDDGQGGFRTYPGQVYWIADQAEFTPRTILTKDERANQVYAAKIRVDNDGLLKIGMYAEITL